MSKKKKIIYGVIIAILLGYSYYRYFYAPDIQGFWTNDSDEYMIITKQVGQNFEGMIVHGKFVIELNNGHIDPNTGRFIAISKSIESKNFITGIIYNNKISIFVYITSKLGVIGYSFNTDLYKK